MYGKITLDNWEVNEIEDCVFFDERDVEDAAKTLFILFILVIVVTLVTIILVGVHR